MAVHRVAFVTIGLVVTGAVTGALCGIAATAPIAIADWIHPTPEPTLAGADFTVVAGTVVGAILGAMLAPLVAWGWLRHVALWRVVLTPALGTLAGASAGWLTGVVFTALNPVALLLGCSILGAVGSSLMLRRRVREALSAPPPAGT